MPFVTVCCLVWTEYCLFTCSTSLPSVPPSSSVCLARQLLSCLLLSGRLDALFGPAMTKSVYARQAQPSSTLTFLDLSTSSVIALNISSTLMLSLAEVSNNLIPIWSANLLASSVSTTYVTRESRE